MMMTVAVVVETLAFGDPIEAQCRDSQSETLPCEWEDCDLKTLRENGGEAEMEASVGSERKREGRKEEQRGRERQRGNGRRRVKPNYPNLGSIDARLMHQQCVK
ncbi:hypothetical protein CsSME_00025580 [Camellia sinensis var. sinensis]